MASTSSNNPTTFNYAQTLLPILQGQDYNFWSIQMKTLFISQDLWDMIEVGYKKPADDKELEAKKEEYKINKQKDAKALLYIQLGVGKVNFPRIMDAVTSKDAWEILKNEFEASQMNTGIPLAPKGRTSDDDPAVNSRYYVLQYETLFKAILRGDLDASLKFLDERPEALRARITSAGETALHIAAAVGHLHIIEKLVLLMFVDDLELENASRCTALVYVAAFTNNIKAAKCMVEKNNRLVSIPDSDGLIPVTKALAFNHTETFRYLYFVTPLEVLLPERGNHGATLLNYSFLLGKALDIALDLIKRDPRLVVTRDRAERTFLVALALHPSAYLRESQLTLWQRWMYKWVHVHHEPASAINEISMNIPANARENDYTRSTSPGLFHQLVSYTLNLSGFKSVYDAKLARKQFLALVRAACHAISTFNEEEIKEGGILSSVILAAESGIPELIVEATEVYLPVLWTTNSNGRNIFSIAVQCRQAEVFSLMHGLIFKNLFANSADKAGNNLLHMAGQLAPPEKLSPISGAVLQMQRELQWFKEVESFMPPTWKESLNSTDKMTGRELFTENHKKLVEEGEKWTKDTATSCSVAAALIATITFAAAFTVPGGNNQDTGYPMFLQKKLFMLFIISDAISLFSSTTSLLIFLGLLTSRYSEDDFLKSLPTKLITGLSTLFISTASMMMAFCAALFVMLPGKSWIGILVTLLACAPVTLFVWLQFPLLVEIFMSTYGPSIFDRNVKPWP